MQLKYNQLNTKHYSYTVFSNVKSTRQNTCGQVFVNNLNFSKFKPLTSESEAGEDLNWFIQSTGIPSKLHVDNARAKILLHLVRQTMTEPYSSFQNRAESEIRELKRH